MGYSPAMREGAQDKIQIAFAPGHEFHGAEIEAWREPPVDLLMDLLAWNRLGIKDDDAYRKLLVRFGDGCLSSWNIEDRAGNPVVATGEGLLSQSNLFIQTVMVAWLKEVLEPSAPLVATSIAGSTSVAA